MIHAPMSETINIFFSLAPASQDRDLFEKLRTQLSVLKRQGLINMWYDSGITAGSNIKDIIKSYIRKADIIVLLISADFFASEQCFKEEMQCALEQHATREAHIIPVLLRPTEWSGFSLEEYNILPQNEKAVSIWNNRDTALAEVAKGIHKVVKKLARRLAGDYIPVKPPQLPLFALPYRQNPFFTDREDTLAALHHYFKSEQTVQTQTQALYGLGGIGKTLLAIEYAYRYQSEYQTVLWLNAVSHEVFSSDLLSLAHQLGIPAQDDVDEHQRIATIQRWLQHHDRWLFVIDNLEVENFSLLNQLIPFHSNGHVLLTTHSSATGPFAYAISVTPMPINEGALLLLRRAKLIPEKGSRDDASEEDYLQAIAIAQEFEGYPLALDQAGAYIEETQRTLSSYLKLYHQQKASLLGIRGQLANDHLDPVTTTLSMTFTKIAQIDPHAMELLHFFAFLHPEALPDEIIRNSASSLKGTLHTLAIDPLALDAAIATLRRFSLVHHQADTTTLNIHRIIQVIIRKQLTKKQQRQLASQAVRLINHSFPEVRFQTRKACERYAPQAQHCATLIHDFQLTSKEGPLLLERLGFYYAQIGCYAEAETYLTQALYLQEHNARIDPLDTAQTLNSLGLLYLKQARYQDAEIHHRRALELRENIVGPEHPKTVESLHNLALLYGDRGEYHRAEQIYLRVLSLEERTKGSFHPDVARTLNNLALMYYHQGHYHQAETTYHRTLAIYKRSLPSDHPDQIYPLDGLGSLAEAQGNYQQAEELYQQAFTICKQAHGEMHPETAHSMNKLADIAESQGNYQQAEILYKRALSIGEQILGPEHPDVALFLNNLAFLMHRQGQYYYAEDLYQRALNIYEQVLGPMHPNVAHVLNNLGQLSRNIKNEERAEKLLLQALAIYEQSQDSTPDIAQVLSDLADLRTDQCAYEEAVSLFQRALAILLQALDPEHPDVALVQKKYTSLLEHINKNKQTTQKQDDRPSERS